MQPWAHYILAGHTVYGLKHIENRAWPTNHRGTMLIHAGAQIDWQAPSPLDITKPLRDYSWTAGPRRDVSKIVGAIVGSVELVDVHRTTDCDCASNGYWAERGMVYHWVLRGPIIFSEPIYMPGKQKLWSVEATEQLERELGTRL